MFTGFSKIIEERIRKAQEKGAFENLEGAGKPLDLKDDSHIAEDLRLAHKILKNAVNLTIVRDVKLILGKKLIFLFDDDLVAAHGNDDNLGLLFNVLALGYDVQPFIFDGGNTGRTQIGDRNALAA